MSKTKTTAKKFAAGVVSFAMAVSFVFGGAVAPAQAQTVEELTAQINSLLSTISALQAQLSTLSGGSSTTTGTGYQFTTNLSQGDTGVAVMELQKFLNTDPLTRVSVTGAGSPGNETSYFGPATKAAVIKFQNQYASEVLAPVGLAVGTGYFGPSSRAKANMLNTSTGSTGTTGGGTTTVPTGNSVNVSLSATSPSPTVLVTGQAIGDLAHFTFANTSATEAKVTKVTFNRTGVSTDSVLSNIYLFDGQMRLTDAATVSSGVVTFSSPTSGLFTIPAGTTKTVSVRSDISGGSGQTVGVSLASVDSTVAVAGSFPIAGANHSIATGTMGTVAFTYTGPTGATDNPANEVRVFEAQTVVSTNDARLESLTIENRGTSADGDLQNFKLYVDGVQVGSSVAQTMNDRATFDLTSNPVTLETGTRIIKVLADIVKGSSETYDIQIRRESDVRIIDTEFTQPILATDSNGFAVSAASANTIAAGSLSVVKAANSPSGNITVGATSVLMSSFEFRATGEDVKIEAAKLWVDQAATAGMDNVKVFVNGSQVGSTRDLVADANPDDDGTEFTFGSSFIAKAGEITKVDIYGDAKTAAGTDFANGTTVDVGISVASADTEGLNSGNTVSAISEVEGNSRTVAASSITATKATGYGDQTVIAGSNDVKIGSFVLSAGSTEGINVNTIVINLSSANTSSITDLMLKSGSTQIGTTKSVPSTDNSFSVNFNVPESGTKIVDVYANIKSGADDGTIVATVDSTTGGTGETTANTATVGSVVLQTITVGTGTLTVTAHSSTPEDYVALDGSTDVHVGSFEFKTLNSDFTLRELLVKVPSDAATSVTNVTLKNGSTEIASAALTLPSTSQSHGTSTFTGLEVDLPEGSTIIDVYVDLPTIASAGQNISGKAITVVLDADNGFKATDAAGTEDSSLAADVASTDDTTGDGTVYVRHSAPTLSSTPASGTLSAGSNKTIGNVTVTADSAGPIAWKKMVFNVSKTSGVTVGATSTLAVYRGSTQVAGTFATTTGDFAAQSEALASDATSGDLIFIATDEQEVASSESYTLRGTVGITGTGLKSLDVSIQDTSSTVVTDSFADIHTAAGDVSESFVWSDLSADVNGSHTESTDDWTNDALVNTTPLTIGNLTTTI